MSFRFAIAGISHETNTYCKQETSLSEFRVLRGEEIVDVHNGVRSYIGGMIRAAADVGAVMVPVFHAGTQPSGTISADAYATMRGELLEGIRSVMPLDAVALALHGAGVVNGTDDLEGDLCQSVRDLVGPEVKIVVTLDLHGNITQKMADAADMCFGCHYYPHTDGYERGIEAVNAIPRLMSGEWRPVSHVEYLPMLIPSAATALYPAKAVNEVCWEIEKRPGMLDCTFFHGFPYTDTPQVGAMIFATSNGDKQQAIDAAKEAARFVWNNREDFQRENLTGAQAIEGALAVDGGPVVINDTADNPGGGSPGDATHILRAMLDAGLNNSCFGHIYDPQVAAQAHRAGAGSTIKVSLGGKYDDFHGAPVEQTVYVKSLADGKFIQQTPMGRGTRVDLGKTARLVAGGVDIIVSSVRTQTLDPEVFLLHGIDITRYKIVVVKSSNHFRAGFEPYAKAIITADSPGLTTLHIPYFPRERSPRPIWPVDNNATYSG